jgi:hypothetical protein
MVLALVEAATDCAAQGAERLTLYATLVDRAGIARPILQRARQETAKIYHHLGIELLWREDARDTHRFTFIIVHEPFDPRHARGQALGMAPGTREVRGRHAWVFYNRLEQFATTYGTPRELMLGLVMAHEMGHLLLPYDHHTTSGLMRAAWSRTDIEQAAKGQLTFSSYEAGLIRARLREQTDILVKR